MGCGAVSQARDGEEGSRLARWDIRGRDEAEGIADTFIKILVARWENGKKDTLERFQDHAHVVNLDGRI